MTRSNVCHWQELQRAGYFHHHPLYRTPSDELIGPDGNDVYMIESFLPLRRDMKVVVIGCGYGRESAEIAPRVAHVWGIDVADETLALASDFLTERGVSNFTPVHVDRYKGEIPAEIDLVYSMVVMQHLTRDLVVEYFEALSGKLLPGGSFLVQFVEDHNSERQYDADLKVYEPSVSWTSKEISSLCQSCGLRVNILTLKVTPTASWHWAHATKPR
jgi:cyclopropane fatty-acyl-phospholipid synthase-like methyltransferase